MIEEVLKLKTHKLLHCSTGTYIHVHVHLLPLPRLCRKNVSLKLFSVLCIGYVNSCVHIHECHVYVISVYQLPTCTCTCTTPPPASTRAMLAAASTSILSFFSLRNILDS